MHGVQVYRMYLAMKQHFTKPNFDFFQYNGQVNAKEETYQQRNDFWFFETIAKKHTKEEIQELLLASFIVSEDTSKVWIGTIKNGGKDRWVVWKKLQESLSYTVEQDLSAVAEHLESKGHSFNSLFESLESHPTLLRLFIRRTIHLETLVIMDICLGFMKDWDKQLNDPLWESVSLKIKKYKPFLSIDRNKYQRILRSKFCE
tara:strand:- start:21 stop:626 length:606 start_codon:yes stop_codon:yes gene_type:complete